MIEQVSGPPVSVAIERQPLARAIDQLRAQTGANIVVDFGRMTTEPAKTEITATFDDVRLFTALQVIGDMAGLKPVAMNNVYYLTSPENAHQLQEEVNRDLFGGREPAGQVLVPPGFVTDGYQYFPRTADMKPADPFAKAYLGGGGPGGVKPVPAPPPAKKDEKK